MQLKTEQLTPTKLKLTITADQAMLDNTKQHVLRDLGANVKIQGFRPGKAPEALIEKQLDQNLLQSEFLEHAINNAFVGAVESEKLRPVAQPKIDISKFVPFSTLEFTAEVEVVGDIELADYKKIKLSSVKPTVTADDVNGVIANLRTRAADKVDVDRAAKSGDEVTFDFKGVDAKTKESIAGADGNDYPLVLGSNAFIPGFEANLEGLKTGDAKDFTLTFPKDYGVAALQNRKVTFSVTIHAVKELKEPKLDDSFAESATGGRFKTMAELKADIKQQLQAEQSQQSERQFDNDLLQKIADQSSVDIPAGLVDEEIDRMEDEEKRNIAYRGQTWQEHLDEEGITAEAHHEKQRPVAEQRVKIGLVLGAISEAEAVTVTPEELEIRMQLLKGQYSDAAMQAELDKPEARRDIASRLLTEKTLIKLRGYVTKA